MPAISAPSLPVSDAARNLGVSEQRVRAMISAGSIEAVKVAGAWWIPAGSLASVVASDRQSGRPFGLDSAWILLLIASGESASWAYPKARWRMSVALSEYGSLAAVLGKLSRRSVRHAFEAHPAELSRLADSDELMLKGISAAAAYKLGLQGGNKEVEAYVPASAIEKLALRHGLIRGDEPNVILRAIPDDIWPVLHRPIAPLAAVLADLSEHADPRARRIAYERAGRLEFKRRIRG